MRTRRTAKSLLSLLCAAVLIALLCPLSDAWATEGAKPVAEVGGQSYSTLAEAIDAAAPGSIVGGGSFSADWSSPVASYAVDGEAPVLSFVSGGRFDNFLYASYVADGFVQVIVDDHVEVHQEQAFASDMGGKAMGSVVSLPSSIAPELSASSAQELANVAAQAAASLKRADALPAGFEVSAYGLQCLWEATSSAEENDALFVVLSVEAVPASPDEGTLIGEEGIGGAYGFDVSVYVDVVVRDVNGGTKAAASAAVTKLPYAFELTVTVPGEFPLSGKDIRLARGDGDAVEYVPVVVDGVANTMTFSTDCPDSYTVLAAVPVVPMAHKVTFVDKANGVTSVVDVEDGKTVARPADPSFAGYDFVGWFVDEGAKTLYDFNTLVSGDLTLYAGYKKAAVSPSTNDDDKNAEKAPATRALPQTGDSDLLGGARCVAVLGTLLVLTACVWRRCFSR